MPTPSSTQYCTSANTDSANLPLSGCQTSLVCNAEPLVLLPTAILDVSDFQSCYRQIRVILDYLGYLEQIQIRTSFFDVFVYSQVKFDLC